MVTSAILADMSGGVLFTVPAEDWNAIGQRVDAAISLSGIAKRVTQYLPGFDALVRACQDWSGQTQPATDSAADVLAQYCDAAITAFEQLRTDVSGPLTPRYVAKLGQDWRSILPQTSRVDDAAGRMRGVWEALSADLNALVSEHIDVTAEFIVGLQIDSALTGWAGLRSEAQSFLAQHATRTSS